MRLCLVLLGSYAGAVLGMPLSGIMTDFLGWEACFYFYGRNRILSVIETGMAILFTNLHSEDSSEEP